MKKINALVPEDAEARGEWTKAIERRDNLERMKREAIEFASWAATRFGITTEVSYCGVEPGTGHRDVWYVRAITDPRPDGAEHVYYAAPSPKGDHHA